jgi:hypothetical protein
MTNDEIRMTNQGRITNDETIRETTRIQAPTMREGIEGKHGFEPLTYVRGLDIKEKEIISHGWIVAE